MIGENDIFRMISVAGFVFLFGSACNSMENIAITRQSNSGIESISNEKLERGPVRLQVFYFKAEAKIQVKTGVIQALCPENPQFIRHAEGEYQLADRCVVEVLEGTDCVVAVDGASINVSVAKGRESNWIRFDLRP